MKITIKGNPKEIADLALELQSRHETKKIKNMDLLENQLELLSRTSERCGKWDNLIQYIPELTHAMVEISQFLCSAGGGEPIE